jgi:hypothetical protein
MGTIPARRATLLVACITLLGACARAQEADSSDVAHALALLERAGLSVERDAIQRVLRDEYETVVWVEPRLRGLPVFGHQVGYAFEADGSRMVEPGSNEPLVLGGPVPRDADAPAARAALSAKQAKAAFRRHTPDVPGGGDAGAALDATLGYADGPGGGYVLAWRVRPSGPQYPVVFIDAMSGALVSQDGGIRCVVAPCP